jgi:hypothetical protein
MIVYTGLTRARISFAPTCTCNECGRIEASSSMKILETGTIPLSCLDGEIQKFLSETFFDPPIGWEVNGRGNYRCIRCMQAKSDSSAS